jgi:hypothetical protein
MPSDKSEGGMRRSVIVSIVCALTFFTSAARAQEFPSGTVRLLVPFAAGGPTDVVTRILADVIAGRVPLMFDIWHSSRRYVEAGELKLIAGAGPDPLPGAEALPVIDKTYPGVAIVAFNAVIAPGRHAARGAGETLRRHPRGGDLAGLRRAHPGARDQRLGRDAEGARCLVREGNREVGRDRQGGEFDGGVTA